MTEREHVRILLTILRNQAVLMIALQPLASTRMQQQLGKCLDDTEGFLAKLNKDDTNY